MDESGKALLLLPNEYRKIAFQPYLIAKKYLEVKWEATPDEIAMWLMDDEIKIKIYSSMYSGAWIIDVRNFKCHVNLNYFLNTCQFDKADLEQFEPDERWFTYPELTERWRDYRLFGNLNGKKQAPYKQTVAKSSNVILKRGVACLSMSQFLLILKGSRLIAWKLRVMGRFTSM